MFAFALVLTPVPFAAPTPVAPRSSTSSVQSVGTVRARIIAGVQIRLAERPVRGTRVMRGVIEFE